MLQTIYPEVQNFMPQAVSGGTYQSFFTLQTLDQTQGPTGNPVGTWSKVAGVVNIACQDAPPSIARIQATEVKAVSEIMSKGMRHVLLDRCFPDAINWSSYGYRCIVDGVTYDLLGAENDSQLTQTRLDMQLVTV